MSPTNRRLLIPILILFALCLIATNVSASAERLSHTVYNDTGRETMTTELVPGLVKMVSEVEWNNHIVSNSLFDASGNLHIASHYANTGKVNGEIWQNNGVEWVKMFEWSQRLNTIGGYNQLIVDFLSETQTSKQLDIRNEKYQAIQRDPSTGEVISSYEYTVIAHLFIKWLNGELQFEQSWTINRP